MSRKSLVASSPPLNSPLCGPGVSNMAEIESMLDLNATAKGKHHQEGKTREQIQAERKARANKKKADKAARIAKAKAQKQANAKKGQIAQKQKGQKGQKGGNNQKPPRSGSNQKPMNRNMDDPKVAALAKKGAVVNRTAALKQVALFSHLPQWEKETSISLELGFSQQDLHPAIVRVGLRIASGTIVGSNARCTAMLNAFQEYIRDYQTPPNKTLSRDLHASLKPIVRFLDECRQKSFGMGTAIRAVKHAIVKLPYDMPQETAKKSLTDTIDQFINERIVFADEVIVGRGVKRISDGDVILTFAKSHVVEKVILQAHELDKKFRVIVVDSRPKLEGKVLLKRLVQAGVSCSYILLNAIGYVIHQVTKIFIGAHGMLMNGNAISRVGSAVVGVMAKEFNVPLLMFCETYKFHETVLLDSFTSNELGDPDELISTGRDDARYGVNSMADWRDIKNLSLLNLTYDVMPGEFVNMVITEIGEIPTTAVPVIIREYHNFGKK